MEVGYIITGVISALIAIIMALGAMLKFYLPKLKKNNSHNPGSHEDLSEIRRGLQKLNETMTTHAQTSTRDHQDVMAVLQRIEGKME
jgi:hypothetical protein